LRTLQMVLLATLASLTLTVNNQSALAQEDKNFRRETRQAVAALADVLARDNLFPIALPEGQVPGDAYTYSNFWLPESRAKDCFTDLKPEVSAWPAVEQATLSDSSADGKLSLLRLLHLSGAAKATASVTVSFTDVQSRTVTRQQLLNALRKADCPYLLNALEAKSVPTPSWFSVGQQVKERPMIVLHRVVEARRRIIISLLDSGEGGLQIDNPQKIIGALGLEGDPRAKFIDGELAAKFNVSRDRGVVIEDSQRVPVAFTPVALPSVRIAPLLSGSADGPPEAVDWVPIDAANNGMTPLLTEWRKELIAAPN
jgi:hypothetical protein